MTMTHTNPTTFQARALRRNASPAEEALWSLLRGRRLGGHKFVRQQPIGPYFADFVCRSRRLVIEIDDGEQNSRERNEYMLRLGYSVYRIPQSMAFARRVHLCETILAALEGRLDRVLEAEDLRFHET